MPSVAINRKNEWLRGVLVRAQLGAHSIRTDPRLRQDYQQSACSIIRRWNPSAVAVSRCPDLSWVVIDPTLDQRYPAAKAHDIVSGAEIAGLSSVAQIHVRRQVSVNPTRHRTMNRSNAAMTRRCILSILLCLMHLSCAPMMRRGAVLSPPATRGEIARVVDALHDEASGLVFAGALIDEAVAILRRIRAQYPETRTALAVSTSTDNGTDHASLTFRAPETLCADTTGKQAATLSGRADRWLNPWATQNARFDSVTASLGGARIYHLKCYERIGTYLTVYYEQAVNVRVLSTAFPPIAGFRVWPEVQIGGGDVLRIVVDPDSWTIRLSAGWGDCPSGCTFRHNWTFSYAPASGTLALIGESGPALPPERRPPP